MSFVSFNGTMEANEQGSADHEVQQEGGNHDEDFKLSSHQDHQGSVHEEIPKAEQLDTEAKKGDDPERACIQQLVQLSEDIENKKALSRPQTRPARVRFGARTRCVFRRPHRRTPPAAA